MVIRIMSKLRNLPPKKRQVREEGLDESPISSMEKCVQDDVIDNVESSRRQGHENSLMGENEVYVEEVADNYFLNNLKDNNLCNVLSSNSKCDI